MTKKGESMQKETDLRIEPVEDCLVTLFKQESKTRIEEELRELHGEIIDLAVKIVGEETGITIQDLADSITQALALAIATHAHNPEHADELIDVVAKNIMTCYSSMHKKLSEATVCKVNLLDL